MQLFFNQLNKSPATERPAERPLGFTLIELLVVIAIIAILAGISIPAIKTLSKSNDQSQATNVVRSMIASARAVAVSQHRMAGVVFFEETPVYSSPVNANQTAMQIFVEDYEQRRAPGYPLPTDTLDYHYDATSFLVDHGGTAFVSYSAERQYLPGGVKLAALNDSIASAGVSTAESATPTLRARAILFDANGQLLLRSGLSVAPLGTLAAGTYPRAYGDWGFYSVGGTVTNASSSPGFFLYSKSEYDAQNFGSNDALRRNWLLQHSDVVIVNSYTGSVVR